MKSVAMRVPWRYHIPMHELDLIYVEGFLSAAFDDGLTKEAAAELLMHNSVQRGNPWYAEGFYAHGARPFIGPEDYEKRASIKDIVGGLWQVGRGVLGTGKDILSGTARGARNFAGPARKLQQGGIKPSWVARNPLKGFAIGTTGAGLGSYGIHRMVNAGRDAHAGAVPFLPGTDAYDGPGAKARQEGLSDSYSKGVFDLNRQLNSGAGRQSELEAAVAAGGPESHIAAAELAKLRNVRGGAADTKARLAQQLSGAHRNISDTLTGLTGKRDNLQATRGGQGGVGGWFRRLWYNVNGNGLGADDELDRNISNLQRQIGENSSLSGIVQDQQRRLDNGSIGAVKVPSQAEVQRNFFPTYR